jgi:DNA-binding transcriptional regulator GbsR (MarR family)
MKSQMEPTSLDHIRQKFVETTGHVTQSLGVGRVLGQVYAYLYFSPQPQSLDDLTKVLEISKGSASMSVRQLEQWGALRRIWIKGDRKDYYEALDSFGKIIRKALLDMIGRKMEIGDSLLEQSETMVKETTSNTHLSREEIEFMKNKVAKIRAFRNRTQRIWDSSILSLLLK